MKKMAAVVLAIGMCAVMAHADTIILGNGTSYTGQYSGARIQFTDQQGIKYTFPRADVQTMVFNTSVDTVSLRSGKSYVGHFSVSDPIDFTGAEGIQYQFPVRDVESLVLNDAGRIAPTPEHAKVLPFGTNLVVRTDETIDSTNTT
ncbi:MAG: hypothetical protein ACJ71S_11390, partial [Acidobacteriaceae bacterium]